MAKVGVGELPILVIYFLRREIGCYYTSCMYYRGITIKLSSFHFRDFEPALVLDEKIKHAAVKY